MNKPHVLSIADPLDTLTIPQPTLDRARTVRYVGPVTRATSERVLTKIGQHVEAEPEAQITLFVTSTGGPTGTATSDWWPTSAGPTPSPGRWDCR